MNLVKVVSSTVSNALQKVKFLRFGDGDVQEKKTVTPYGIDSNPIPEMIALYAETGVKGESVLVGFINKNAIAQPGELRFFSTDTAGVEKSYLYFKADGFVDFNGTNDNMVRFSKLKTGFDQLKTDFNNLVTLFNAHQHLSTTPGNPTSTPTAIATSSTATINSAKIRALRTSATD